MKPRPVQFNASVTRLEQFTARTDKNKTTTLQPSSDGLQPNRTYLHSATLRCPRWNCATRRTVNGFGANFVTSHLLVVKSEATSMERVGVLPTANSV